MGGGDKECDLFADIHRVVTDPLDLPRYDIHADSPLEHPLVAGGLKHLRHHPAVQLVNGVVKLGQRLGEVDITAGQRVHCRADHAQRELAHLLKIPQYPGDLRQTVDKLGDLGQVHCLVANPLQMQVDVEQGGQEPQVGRDWGLEREQVQDASLDIQIERVYFVVAPDYLIAERQVAAQEGLQCLFQQELGLGGCLLDLVLKGAQLFGEALASLGHQPTLLCCRARAESPWL